MGGITHKRYYKITEIKTGQIVFVGDTEELLFHAQITRNTLYDTMSNKDQLLWGRYKLEHIQAPEITFSKFEELREQAKADARKRRITKTIVRTSSSLSYR